MWSGGKDCALALDRARRAGLEVRMLLNFHDPATGRVRFHATRVGLLEAQAAALGVSLRAVGVPWEGMAAAFPSELAELRAAGYRGVVFGDIHLADVRAWYEGQVVAAGLEHVEPIWGEPSLDLVREFVRRGGRAVVTCCEGSLASWLGRSVDESFVADVVAAGVDPAGENGEFHTFAFDGPWFAAPVAWRPGARLDGEPGFVQLDLE